MRKNKIIVATIALLFGFGMVACEDILDQQSVNSFTEESVFQDVNVVKSYLGICYDRIGGDKNNVLGMREDLLAGATDECLCIHRPTAYTFLKGTMSPDDLGHFGNWRFSYLQWNYNYQNIQRVNLLLANIDNVPTDLSSDLELLARYKAEGYFIRAFNYANLFRSYGGVILQSEPFNLEEDFSTQTRSSAEETLNFILADISKAMEGLPEKDGIEQGRANKGAVAALKSRVLSWAAGHLMNGGYESGNNLVSFGTSSRTQRLQAAKAAAKEIIDGNYGSYALVGETQDPPSPLSEADVDSYASNFYNLFTQKGEWNEEVIWGIQYLNDQGNQINTNKWNGPNGYHNWGNNGPAEPVVRKFEMADGTSFEWDAYDPGNETLREFTAAELAADPLKNPYNGREPRFYATVFYDGAPWQARPSDAAGIDPLGIIQTGKFIDAEGTITHGLDTRNGLIENWNGTKNGYYLKKFADEATVGQYFDNENAWLEFRMAEVYLDYAEACIELGGGDLQTGIDALNMVRNRAGLPDRVTTDQAEAREFYRHERQIEMFAEGDRWFMIRKWMIAQDVIEDVHPIVIEHTTDGPNAGSKWFYDEGSITDARMFNQECYWLPISRTEMNKAPQLTNNPGYN